MAILRTRIEVDTSGLRQLSSVSKQRGVTLKGARAGAKVVQRAGKSAAPKRRGSGALKQSLGVKAAKGKRGKTLAYAVVGPRKKFRKTVTVGGRTTTAVPAFYAHLVEKGIRPHSLKKGSLLARRNKKAVGQGVGRQHPGAKPRPFLGPAYESNKGVIRDVMLRTMAEEITKEMTRAAKKGK